MFLTSGKCQRTAEDAKSELLSLAPLVGFESADSIRSIDGPHFALYVKDELERRYRPIALIFGESQIMTSLEIPLQSFAEQVARDFVLAREDQHNVNTPSGCLCEQPNTAGPAYQ